MFKLPKLFTILSILSLSTSFKLKDIGKTNCSSKNLVNCTNNSFELIPKGKIHKLLPKKKKSKNIKMIRDEQYMDSGSGSFDDELSNIKPLPKLKKSKELKKGKKNKLSKESKFHRYKLGYQNKTDGNLTKKNNHRHHSKKNDLPLILVTTFSGILFVSLVIGSIYLSIKYRNGNKDLIEQRTESEILLPKRDYNEYNTI